MPYTTPYAGTPYRSNYEPRMYDNSQATANMSELVRAKYGVQAREQLQRGQSSANLGLGLAAIGANAMSQLADYKMKEPQRKLEERRIADEMHTRQRASDFEGLERMAGDGQLDDVKRSALYEQEGFHEQATKVRDRARQVSLQTLAEANGKIDLVQKQLSQASQMLQGVDSIGADVLKQSVEYEKMVPQLRAVVGPDLAKNIPDRYDQGTVKSLIAWGQTAGERLQLQREASLAAAEAIKVGENAMESQEKWNIAFSKSMLAAQSPEDWKQFTDLARKLPHPPPEQMFTAWGDYTPEKQALAKSILTKNVDRTGSPDQVIFNQFLAEHPTATAEEMSAFQHRRTGTGTSGGMTPATRQGIEKAHIDGYMDIERRLDTGELSPEAAVKEKALIEERYRNQLGMFSGGAAPPPDASMAGLASRGTPAAPVAPAAPVTRGRTAQPALVQVQAPPDASGKSMTTWLPPEQAAEAVKRGGKIISGGQQAAPAAAPATPAAAPAAAPPPPPPPPSAPGAAETAMGNVMTSALGRGPQDTYVPARPIPPLIDVNAAKAALGEKYRGLEAWSKRMDKATRERLKKELKRGLDLRGNMAELQRKR